MNEVNIEDFIESQEIKELLATKINFAVVFRGSAKAIETMKIDLAKSMRKHKVIVVYQRASLRNLWIKEGEKDD